MTQRALLIGIDYYPEFDKDERAKHGCVNDARKMKQVLECFGFDSAHVHVLASEQQDPLYATKADIEAAMDELIKETQEGDVVVFYFSGHGSRIYDRRWPAYFRETLVPQDGGREPGKIRDITDRQISSWIDALSEEKKSFVTVILDSCHSGSATRSAVIDRRDDILGAKQVPPAEVTFHEADLSEFRSAAKPDSRGPSGWLRTQPKAVVLTACHAHQQAYAVNYLVPERKPRLVPYGAFTYHLTNTLMEVIKAHEAASRKQAYDKDSISEPTDVEETWKDIFDCVRRMVTDDEKLDQEPQREGNSQIFGTSDFNPRDGIPATEVGLATRRAVVIGIDDYRKVVPLRTAGRDATEVARVLRVEQDYKENVRLLLDEQANPQRINDLLTRILPGEVQQDDGLLFYFAGHGTTKGDGLGSPEGSLLLWDGGEPADGGSQLSMDYLRQRLTRLKCRHLLVVLDCCFAGTFRWASSRGQVVSERPLFESQYKVFLNNTAWHVLTSAAHDERAADRAPGEVNTRDGDAIEGHSPFARAFLEGLEGHADSSRGGFQPDGVITVTELHQYIFEKMVRRGQRYRRQTPGLWPLLEENLGEFIFANPQFPLLTAPDPELDESNNPWLGTDAYGEDDADLFFGRERPVREIRRLLDAGRLVSVVGASGSGKSSVVAAGLLPRLKAAGWNVERLPRRPDGNGERMTLADDPVSQLEEAAQQIPGAEEGRRLLSVDALEDLFRGPSAARRRRFAEKLRELIDAGVRVLLTLRSDFEPHVAGWVEDLPDLKDLLARGRYQLPACGSEELRQIIVGPARAKGLWFEEPEPVGEPALVGRLVDDVVGMPGALPLLSQTLREMYMNAVERRKRRSGDRELNWADYKAVQGVTGWVRREAEKLFRSRDEAQQKTLRQLLLRMVRLEGDKPRRRRVEALELQFPEPGKQEQIDRTLENLIAGHLVVADGDYLEPAHDVLVSGWERLEKWFEVHGLPTKKLLEEVQVAARAWNESGRVRGQLWSGDPRLPPLAERRDDLNWLEREFVDASLQRTVEDRRRTENAMRIAVAANLGFEDPTRAAMVLHEVEEPDETPSAVARMSEALRKRLARRIFHGHEGAVRVALFDPKGRRLLTASDDGTARLWNVVEAVMEGRTPGDRTRTPAEAGVLRGHGAKILTAAWNADGTRVVTASADGTARVWTVDGLDVVGEPAILEHGATVWSAAFSPETDKKVATACEDGNTRVWTVDSSQPDGQPLVLPASTRAQSVCFSTDGQRVVAYHPEEKVARVWNARGSAGPTPKKPVILKDVHGTPTFGPDGHRVAAASDCIWGEQGRLNSVRVWDSESGKVLRELPGHRRMVLSVAWSGDGKRLATTSTDKTVRLWKLAEPKRQIVLRGHRSAVLSAAWNPRSTELVTASVDGTARVWNTAGGKSAVFRGHRGAVTCAGWNPGATGGTEIVTASVDGTARVWTVDRSVEPRVLRGHQKAVTSTAWSAGGKRILSVSRDDTARVWSADGRSPSSEISTPEAAVRAAAFAAGGTRVFTVRSDGTALAWEAGDPAAGRRRPATLSKPRGRMKRAAWSPDGGKVAIEFGGRIAGVWSIDALTGEPEGEPVILDGVYGRPAWSPDSRWIVAPSEDRTARLWSLASGASTTLVGHQRFVRDAAFSSDGQRVVTASEDGTARLWNVEDRENPTQLGILRHRAAVNGAAFSPRDGRVGAAADDERVVTASEDGIARVWKPDGSEDAVELAGHEQAVLSAAWSPDGRKIVTISKDRTARVWNADGHGEPLVLHGYGAMVRCAAFARDGRRLVTGFEDGCLRVWTVGGEALQERIRQATEVCLDPEFRTRYFCEEPEVARERYARCEEGRGRRDPQTRADATTSQLSPPPGDEEREHRRPDVDPIA